MKIAKEIKIGALILLGIAVLIYGYSFLQGKDIFDKQKHFYAKYKSVSGLTPGNNVQVSGFVVGKVDEVKFNPKNQEELVVKFNITNKNLKIPEGTTAKIVSFDLLGSKGIQLVLGNSTNYAEQGDTLLSDIEQDLAQAVDARLKPLEDKTKQLIGSIDSVVTVVQAILDKDARTNLSASFESIKRALNTFEKTSIKIDGLMDESKTKVVNILSNVESISGNIRNNNKELTAAIKNFNQISDSLAQSNLKQTINRADAAMADAAIIMEKINSGQGSVGKLINNDSLYNNLNAAAADLDKLLYDLRENPHKYVHISLIDFHREGKESRKERKRQEKEEENN